MDGPATKRRRGEERRKRGGEAPLWPFLRPLGEQVPPLAASRRSDARDCFFSVVPFVQDAFYYYVVRPFRKSKAYLFKGNQKHI
jgi:hypothetical protein